MQHPANQNMDPRISNMVEDAMRKANNLYIDTFETIWKKLAEARKRQKLQEVNYKKWVILGAINRLLSLLWASLIEHCFVVVFIDFCDFVSGMSKQVYDLESFKKLMSSRIAYKMNQCNSRTKKCQGNNFFPVFVLFQLIICFF